MTIRNPNGDMTWSHPSPSWPRYWRRFARQPWNGDMARDEEMGRRSYEGTARAGWELKGYTLLGTGDDLVAIQELYRRSWNPTPDRAP